MRHLSRVPFALPSLVLVLALAACGPKGTAPSTAAAAASSPVAASAPRPKPEDLVAELKGVLAAHRQVIVLLADEKGLGELQRAQDAAVGQAIFHANRERVRHLEAMFDALTPPGGEDPTAVLAPVLDFVESDPSLFDADRLAFRDLLMTLQADVARGSTLGAIRLHKRLADDLEALAEIEQRYDAEIRAIFSRFETRAIAQKRERWDDYVAHLRTLYTRQGILGSQPEAMAAASVPVVASGPASVAAVAASAPSAPAPAIKGEPEIFGNSLPPKVVALTFDDGPHGTYTAEITAILKQYGAPGTFFEVGTQLGAVTPEGKAVPGPLAAVTKRLVAEGYAVGNHSMTHAQLSKLSGDALRHEMMDNDALIQSIVPGRPPLFRFPYGARNAEAKGLLAQAHLRSVMWNIDSMDWADPIPKSIADRVMKEVDEQGRGIILFHDIHERTVRALPLVMERLAAEGYRFAGWDGQGYSVPAETRGGGAAVATGAASGAALPAAVAATTSEGAYWAVVIGIDDYAHWPHLGHAGHDADAMRELLTTSLGFDAAHVVVLKDRAATRAGILSAFEETLPKAGLKKTDNLLVFFAGHGATRRLSSGRDLGYIVPADAGTDDVATDAIPMTQVQDVSESLVARHVLFVMDACYSGLGLVRGAGSRTTPENFLRDNAHRVGRQMLTAGGADQMVADGGPDGHSIFTWTLLQGLQGKADLNGDRIVTGTELAAYVAPAVAAVSRQTPAFGSLPGSEGGEFVFALASKDDFISDTTPQLAGDAIALNGKLAQAAAVVASAAASGGVKVKDLQGLERTLAAPAAAPVDARKLARAANDRGMQAFREKDYATARDQFQEALKQQPDFALAANNLGFVFYKLGDDAQAVKYFEATLKMDPSRAVAWVNLGDSLQRQGQAERAKQAFSTYLALAPKGASADHARQALGN